MGESWGFLLLSGLTIPSSVLILGSELGGMLSCLKVSLKGSFIIGFCNIIPLLLSLQSLLGLVSSSRVWIKMIGRHCEPDKRVSRVRGISDRIFRPVPIFTQTFNYFRVIETRGDLYFYIIREGIRLDLMGVVHFRADTRRTQVGGQISDNFTTARAN